MTLEPASQAKSDVSHSGNDKNLFSISSQKRSRNTIIDLLRIVANDARPGYLICDVDITYSSSLLERLLKRGSKVTITSILIKAIAVAQQTHSLSRTESIPLGSLVTYNDIVAGFTVERVVNGQPTVFLGEIERPDLKSIKQIADELKTYASEPTKQLPPIHLQDLFSCLPGFLRGLILTLGKSFPFLRLQCQRASFGLTSLGKFGISALLSPCLCSSTFGVGKIEERVVVIEKRLAIRKRMTISYNFDLRVFDFAEAAQFLSTVRDLLEGDLESYLRDDECSRLNQQVKLTARD